MNGPLSHFTTDSLLNLTSSLGSLSKDKGAMGSFVSGPGVTRDQIDVLYRQNWLGGKLVDIPADDATREWRAWSGTKSNVEAMEEIERVHKIRIKVNLAMKWAAKDGGAAIVMGFGDDPAGPLNLDAVQRGGLRFAHVFSRWELSVGEMIRDPESPWFGEPKEYRFALPDGRFIVLHPSRVVPFTGVPRADVWARIDPWGDSIYERVHDSIRDATSALQISASLLQEAKVDVIKIPGLSENVVRADYRDAVMQRFGLAMALKSINNALVLDAEESWEQKTLTFQGLPEITEKLLQVVAGAADMPVTRLYGRSPTGLNATGAADLESYYTFVKGKQQTLLRPALERLDEVLVRAATGRKPRNLFYDWRTLWSPAITDLADVNAKHASAVEAYSRSGVFTKEALQAAAVNQLQEDGFLGGIDDAVKANPGAPGNVQIQGQEIAAATRAKEAAATPPAPATPRRRPPPQTG